MVLCDTDVAVLEDPRTIVIPPRSIGGKVVDTPVPPLEVLHEIFAAAGVPAPPTTPLPWGENQETVAGNSNGGLYLIPAPLLPALAPAWETWARWLLDRRDSSGTGAFHLDQVAMVLALTAEGIGTEQLDVRWNTPIHDLTGSPPDPPVSRRDPLPPRDRFRGASSPTGFPLHRQADRAGERVDPPTLAGGPPTVTFWQWRYLSEAAIGSVSSSDQVATRHLSPVSSTRCHLPPFSTSGAATGRRSKGCRSRPISGSTCLLKRFAEPKSPDLMASSSSADSPNSPSERISPSALTW